MLLKGKTGTRFIVNDVSGPQYISCSIKNQAVGILSNVSVCADCSSPWRFAAVHVADVTMTVVPCHPGGVYAKTCTHMNKKQC